MPSYHQWESAVKKTYEVPSLKTREAIREDYKEVETAVNGFYEKKLAPKKLADTLGNMALGANGEHASAQLYAYDTLIKSLKEVPRGAKPEEDIIASEVFFDVAATTHPVKRAYLLGLLHYYSSQDRLDAIDEKLSAGETNVQLEEETRIIAAMKGAAERLKDDPLMGGIAQYVTSNFPTTIPECEAARLVSTYYAKEPHATRTPELAASFIVDEDIGTGLEGSGVPRQVVCLKPGYHPSQEKLDEANHWGIDLIPQAVRLEPVEVATPEGQRETKLQKTFVEYDINPRLSHLYLRRIRYYKDRNQAEKVKRLEAALHERIWRAVAEDSEAARIIGGPENMVVIKRTIRDWPAVTPETQPLVPEEEMTALIEAEEKKEGLPPFTREELEKATY